jgi:hypothetical protein
MRVATRPFEGPAAYWDPEDPGPFAALAGPMLTGRDGDLALITTAGGCVMHVHPGWAVILPDGNGDGQAVFTPPDNIGDGGTCLWRLAGTSPLRLALRPLSGTALLFDPGDRGEFAALAGPQLLGLEGGTALVRGKGGCVVHAHPGWPLILADGWEEGQAVLSVPENLGDAESCMWAVTG